MYGSVNPNDAYQYKPFALAKKMTPLPGCESPIIVIISRACLNARDRSVYLPIIAKFGPSVGHIGGYLSCKFGWPA